MTFDSSFFRVNIVAIKTFALNALQFSWKAGIILAIYIFLRMYTKSRTDTFETYKQLDEFRRYKVTFRRKRITAIKHVLGFHHEIPGETAFKWKGFEIYLTKDGVLERVKI